MAETTMEIAAESQEDSVLVQSFSIEADTRRVPLLELRQSTSGPMAVVTLGPGCELRVLKRLLRKMVEYLEHEDE